MSSIENKRPVTERRDFKLDLSKCEVRSATADAPATFSGYAAVFNSLSQNLGGFRERIAPGAFRAAIEEGDDVRFLINHDSNLILGRTPLTLSLAEDEIGLRVECELPNTSYANDLVESMRRQDINQMSFGFSTTGEEWREKDPETNLPIRELTGARLFDVSAVSYPAYTDTTAEVRSFIAEHTPELLERAQRAAADLEELNVIETPETDTAELDRARAAFEEARALAGVRVQDDHPCCEGIAVVWNFNDEVQSCHQSREAADAQIEAMTSGAAGAARGDAETIEDKEERVGKTLSQKNLDLLTDAQAKLAEVLEAAATLTAAAVETVELNENTPAGETRTAPKTEWLRKAADAGVFGDTVVDVTSLEERAWTWEDDYALWQLTEMLECASCFVLYERDEDADDSAAATAMKAIMAQLAAMISAQVAEASSDRDADPDAETRDDEAAAADETEERSDRFDRERRRLRLAELELAV